MRKLGILKDRTMWKQELTMFFSHFFSLFYLQQYLTWLAPRTLHVSLWLMALPHFSLWDSVWCQQDKGWRVRRVNHDTLWAWCQILGFGNAVNQPGDLMPHRLRLVTCAPLYNGSVHCTRAQGRTMIEEDNRRGGGAGWQVRMDKQAFSVDLMDNITEKSLTCF